MLTLVCLSFLIPDFLALDGLPHATSNLPIARLSGEQKRSADHGDARIFLVRLPPAKRGRPTVKKADIAGGTKPHRQHMLGTVNS